jgi:multimeric flavodoxin WrbA
LTYLLYTLNETEKKNMKIIGVCGSPRKGNTEWLLSALGEALTQGGAEVEILLLRQMEVKMCRGCLACEKGGKMRQGDCVIKDDMASVYPKLLAADAIVLATPCYMGLLTGLLKNFMDRTCAVWPRLEGKRLAGIAVGEEMVGQAVSNLKYYANLLNMPWPGSVTAFARRPGDAAKIPGIQARLYRLAKKILDPR